MAFISLYRKYRPKKFADLVGQQHIVKTLVNTIKYDRIAHAYLFAGPRGTGKTSTAKVYARALNCLEEEEIEPCGQCRNCQRIEKEEALDVIEIDAASNRGIDEIRELREKVKFYPGEGRYKIYIIDEVHMLTRHAFNALLKTLEEPPDKVVFILATTEPHNVIPTILSRCQRFDFSLLTCQELVGRLEYIVKEEGVEASEQALQLLAEASDGGMRDAISLLDQAISYCDKEITLADLEEMLGKVKISSLSRLVNLIAQGETEEVLQLLASLQQAGRNYSRITADLVDYCRQLMLAANGDLGLAVADLAENRQQLIEKDATLFSQEEINYLVDRLVELEGRLRHSSRPGILLEMTLVRACEPESDDSLVGLSKRLARLEREYSPVKESNVPLKEESDGVSDEESDNRVIREQNKEKEKEKDKENLAVDKKKVQEQGSLEKSQAYESEEPGRDNENIQQQIWQDILLAIKDEDIKTHAMVKESQLPQQTGGKVILDFPPGKKFHLQNARSERDLIANIMQEKLGGNFELEFRLDGKPFSTREGQNQSNNSNDKRTEVADNGSEVASQSSNDIIKRAQRKIGGEIITVSAEVLQEQKKILANLQGGNHDEHEKDDETSSTNAG